MTLGNEYRVHTLCLGLDKQGQILSSRGTKAIGGGQYTDDHLKRSVISSSVAIFLVSALVTGMIVFPQTQDGWVFLEILVLIRNPGTGFPSLRLPYEQECVK